MSHGRATLRAGLFVLVVTAACAAGDPTVSPTDGSSSTAPLPTGSLPPGGTGTTLTPGTDGGTSDTSATPTTTSTTGLDATGPPGSFAAALLRSSLSTDVIVVLSAQSGAALGGSAQDHLVNVLDDVTGKPTDLTTGATVPGGAQSWSASALTAAADAAGGGEQGGGHAVIRLLLVHGSFQGDAGVLGVAVRGDVAAIFVDAVANGVSLVVSKSRLEEAVSTHEVGHLLGLVDLFLDTGRDDPAHPGHSTNPNSVMYWAVDTDLVGQILGGPPPIDFDSADRADLATIAAG